METNLCLIIMEYNKLESIFTLTTFYNLYFPFLRFFFFFFPWEQDNVTEKSNGSINYAPVFFRFPIFTSENSVKVFIFLDYFEIHWVSSSDSFSYLLTIYTEGFPLDHTPKRHKIFRQGHGSSFMTNHSKTDL